MSGANQANTAPKASAVDDVPAIVEALAVPIRDSVSRAATAAIGWTLAAEVVSADRLPRFDQSAVDGYAWAGRAPDDGLQPVEALRAGDPATPLRPGEAAPVMTGAPIPERADRVAMQERCRLAGGRVFPPQTDHGANIRREGEDVGLGTTIAPAGTFLDARHAALFAATGIDEVSCIRPLRILLIATGNELSDGSPSGAQIRDSNTPMIEAMLAAQPDVAMTATRCLDSREELRALFERARREMDLVITMGGMSFGQEDHVRSACQAAGGRFALHSLLMKPGKPVGLARLGDCLHLGLPGNPFAALVAFLLVGRPVLDRLRGKAFRHRWVAAQADFTLDRRPGRVEFFPARLIAGGGGPLLQRLGKGGSARLAPLVAADGLGRIEAGVAQVRPGTPLRFVDFATVFGG